MAGWATVSQRGGRGNRGKSSRQAIIACVRSSMVPGRRGYLAVLGIGLLCSGVSRASTLPISTGTFTQPWCVDGYQTSGDWDREWGYMQGVGINLWIYQWTGDSLQQTTIWPSSLPGYTQSSSYDQVEAVLAAAKRHGGQVYLGLLDNEAWWDKQGSDRTWLLAEASAMVDAARDLYGRYGDRYAGTLAGWYLPWELDNSSDYNTNPTARQNVLDAIAQISTGLAELNYELPLAMAPFFVTGRGVTAQEWGLLWEQLVGESGVDVVMVQDGIGVKHATLKSIKPWLEEVCLGVHTAGGECWSDLENFARAPGPPAGFSPAPPSRVQSQHQVEAPYVDGIVTFSFIAYMSPQFLGTDTYYQAYLTYAGPYLSEPALAR